MVNLVIIIILLVISAFFSASEMAFSTVNRIRLKNYAIQGDKRAKKALEIAESFDKALTTILVGNNVVNIASASLATVAFTQLFGDGAVGVATVIMTVAVLIFGEIIPKSLAKENAEKLALSFAGILLFLIKILTPITFIFSKIKSLVSKLFKGESQPSVTEDELKYIIEEIENEGVLEEQESNLVRSALEFDEIQVNQILVPRVNVVSINCKESIENIKNIFVTEMYSRLPVYDKTIDNIVGVINEKDFFKLIMSGEKSIESIITNTLYISDLRLISEVLRDMQKEKIHMAIVVDQYGGTQGIVTMEDIIEELVGEIYDENDEVVHTLVKVSDGIFEVSGELSIDDMLEQLELPLNLIDSESTSVGGWIMELFGKIPTEDDEISSGIFTIKVLKMTDQKVDLVKISFNEINS